MMKRLALIAASLAVPACAAPLPATPVPASPPSPADGTGPGQCRTAELGQFAGRPATAELGGEILRASGARNLQWVADGMMVTMDFREDRVRVWLDARNRVLRVNCG